MLDKLSFLKTCRPSSAVAWSDSLEATLLAASDAANSQIVKVKYCKSCEDQTEAAKSFTLELAQTLSSSENQQKREGAHSSFIYAGAE